MGCQKATLKRDVVRSPLDSNYHSALIITSFGENFGVAVDRAEMDQPYTFRVQGIHSGTITVASRECGFSKGGQGQDLVANAQPPPTPNTVN